MTFELPRFSACKSLLQIALATLFFFAAAARGQVPPAFADFDAFVEQQLAIWKVPGATVAVVKDGEVLFVKGYGLRDLEKRLPMTPKTVQPIASITKSFTVTALATLVRDGKLAWDRPVREWLPDFRLSNDAIAAQITPRDLVTHRTGLPRHDWVWYGATDTREQLYQKLRHFEFSAGLRERFQYNNFMYMTAGYLGGKVAGTSWEELVRDGVFAPLGMKSSGFRLADLMRAPDHATPYRHDDDENARPAVPSEWDAMGPTASVHSNAEDMARYLQMLAAGGSYSGKTIVAQSDLVEMTNPQMVIPDVRRWEELGPTQYGMGFFVQQYRGMRLVQHGGNTRGLSALLAFLPQQKSGVFVAVNMSGSNLRTVLGYAALDRLAGLPPIDWSSRLKKIHDDLRASEQSARAKKFEPRKQNTQPSRPLDAYVGEYSHPGYGKVAISAATGRKPDAVPALAIEYHGFKSTLEHFHYDVFKVPPNKLDELEETKVQFVNDFDGEVSTLRAVMEDAVAAIEFKRLPDRSLSDPAVLKRFVGRYVVGPTVIDIALRPDNVLTYSISGTPQLEMQGLRGRRFAIKQRPTQFVEFMVDATGNVVEAALQFGDSVLAARKTE